MSDQDPPPVSDHLADLLDEGDDEAAVAYLDGLDEAAADGRKRALRAVRSVAEERPGEFDGLAGALGPFLTDDDRAVRLTTAKLFVTLARADPSVVLPVVDALADRLADDAEFYYVRARCAEALGYVAVDAPGAVADPETLAEFRVGLSFDEPEVTEKLAKALAYVAVGDPSRLRHRIDSVTEHLDDDNDLVRYHLCTALVVVGCEHTEALADATAPLRARLDDENPYVRGRAAEALALLAASDVGDVSVADLHTIDVTDESPAFLNRRVRFLREKLDGSAVESPPDGVGTVESVRAGTDDAVAEMTSADDGACPHCGLDLPDSGPPMCPRCGAPR